MSHTPGPWRIQDAGNDTLWIVVDSTATDVGYISIAEARYGCDAARALGDNDANASLIAAAPLMYAALREARETLYTAVEVGVDLLGFDPSEHVVIKRIDAAIAAAEGRS